MLKGAENNHAISLIGGKSLKNFIKKASHGLVADLFAVNAEIGTQVLWRIYLLSLAISSKNPGASFPIEILNMKLYFNPGHS